MFAPSSIRRFSSTSASTAAAMTRLMAGIQMNKNNKKTTIEINSNNDFVPPAPRRKFRARTMQYRKRRRHNFLVFLVVIFVAIAFVLRIHPKIDNSEHNLNQYRSNNEIEQILDLIPSKKNEGEIKGGRDTNVVVVDQKKNLRGEDEKRNLWVSQDSQPFNERGVAVNAENLVIVAGHSVIVSGHLQDAGSDESDWFLLDYQKGQGLPQAIHAHIAAGIDETRKDSKSLLVFSGGETRAVSGPQTEAQAYYHVADAMNLWQADDGSSVRARTTTEEFATDSFENLLFSIARFREVTGEYPRKITVVSFSFKRRRFETLHAHALRWPADRFAYVGVDPPASTGFNLQRSIEGESKNAAAPFEKDPYGCYSVVLQEKRKSRNPFQRTPPYGLSCPEMRELLEFCGPELILVEQIPWGNGYKKVEK